MKIAFATCVQLGKSCIEKILEMGGTLDLLITLNDEKGRNKSGRIYLDDIAESNNIELLKINNINDAAAIKKVKELEIDWLFIIGWSQIAKKQLLDTPKKGCIGMHPTLLPVGRGRASIPWAILKKLEKTGVTMFKLDEGVDTGDILGQIEIKLDKNTTATDLYANVNKTHIDLMEKYFNDILEDKIILEKQNEKKATYWEGRKPEDGILLESMTMEEAERLVRATTHPYPGAFYIKDNKKVVIWKCKTETNIGNPQLSFRLKDGFLIPIEYTVVEVEDAKKN